MLSFTDDVNLKLVPDTEKYQFIETTIGVDVSMICKGYAEAKIKFLKSYNTSKHTSYNNTSKPASNIKYLDVNNLYPHSMIQVSPTEKLDWYNPKILI